MISLSQIEADLKTALKAKESVKVDTLRGLKTRIQNESISKMGELAEADIIALVRSEVKRRKEAAQVYNDGGRAELAEKELQESRVLEAYLPPQMSESQIGEVVEKVIAELSATAADFGKVMGKTKQLLGDQADGGTIAKIVKEKLK